jgi:Lon protease-like protein
LLAEPKHAVPVFPLPNVVLFPHTMLPLHIFELRYRTMVRDALSGERMIAMALTKPGWERDEQDSGEFHALGCLARFHEVEWLPNDCYDLKVEGISRVRFERRVREHPYRSARVRLVPQEPYTEDDPLVQIERQASIQVFDRLLAAAAQAAEAPPPRMPGPEVSYEAVVNMMCMCLEADGDEKLALLELDSVLERGRRVRERIERRLRMRPQQKPGDERSN